jgi:hypothetical protein
MRKIFGADFLVFDAASPGPSCSMMPPPCWPFLAPLLGVLLEPESRERRRPQQLLNIKEGISVVGAIAGRTLEISVTATGFGEGRVAAGAFMARFTLND